MSVYRSYVQDKLVEHHNKDVPEKKHITFVNGTEWQLIMHFVAYVTRTIGIKGKVLTAKASGIEVENFRLPNAESEEDEWYESFLQFIRLPGDFTEKWDEELVAINKPEPDPEVLPGDESFTTNT
jgi:hypothetical protein